MLPLQKTLKFNHVLFATLPPPYTLTVVALSQTKLSEVILIVSTVFSLEKLTSHCVAL